MINIYKDINHIYMINIDMINIYVNHIDIMINNIYY